VRPNTALQSDRFARKIMAILAFSDAARSRRLNANPFGRQLFIHHLIVEPFLSLASLMCQLCFCFSAVYSDL
jgi:hypothetical protein